MCLVTNRLKQTALLPPMPRLMKTPMIAWLLKHSAVSAKRVHGAQHSIGRKEDLLTLPESKRTPASDFETPLKYFPIGIEHTQPGSDGEQAEPLLSLLTSSHPWLGGTINGSLSAYSATKSFSPRFIRSGADRIESTVGNVGKVTGVEESLRKYLEQGRPDQSNQDVTMDIEQGPSTSAVLQSHGQRTASGTLSIDTLPAYDKNSSPPYEDNRSTGQPAPVANMRPATNRSWSSQLMISTSGLGAALSERSLQSLKFCLSILTKANQHVKNLMDALKRLLQDLKGPSDSGAIEKKALEAGDQDAMQLDERPDKNIIADRIRHLNEEIWQTLRGVVNAVSSYTGGALPENASVVVRWQLMSVPQRWKRAITKVAPQGSDDAASSANRMLAFAIEGIDMMEQVSGVVDSTITSAEKWLDSLGRGGQKQQEQGQAAGDESAGGQATAGAEESQQVADDSGGA